MSLRLVQKNEQELRRLEKGHRSVMEGGILDRGNGLFKGSGLGKDEDIVCGAESERWGERGGDEPGGLNCTSESEALLEYGFCAIGHRKSEAIFEQERLGLELLPLAAGRHCGEMNLTRERLWMEPGQ